MNHFVLINKLIPFDLIITTMLSTKNTCLSLKHKSRGSFKKTEALAKTFKNLFSNETPITRKGTNPTMESSHYNAK